MQEGISVPPAAPPPTDPPAPPTQPTPQAPSPPPPPRKRSKTWLIVVAVILVVLCGCCSFGGFFAYKTYFAAKEKVKEATETIKKEAGKLEEGAEQIEKIKDETQVMACQANLRVMDAAIQAYYAQKQTYPSTFDDLKDAGLLVFDVKCPVNQAAYTIDPATHRAVCPNGHAY